MSAYSEKLNQLTRLGLKRELAIHEDLVDFSSNDYLGLARSEEFHDKFLAELSQNPQRGQGSTGSRLLTGHSKALATLEERIAQFHGQEAALILPSGFQANLALFSTIATKHDTIIRDELCHASIIDGCRLSRAEIVKFRHNDLEDLRQKLAQAKGEKFVSIEGLYSMDGDFGAIENIVAIAREYGAKVIIDEAHSAGCYGHQGRGFIDFYKLNQDVLSVVVAYGKAFGYQGGAILGSKALIDFLVNRARPFIFSTGISHHQVLGLQIAYDLMPKLDEQRAKLQELIAYFIEKRSQSKLEWLPSRSQIQAVIIPGNEAVLARAQKLKDAGLLAMPIRKPSVAAGKERIRICLHSFNTKTEIDHLFKTLAT